MTIPIGAMADEGTNIDGYNTTDNGTTDMTEFIFVKTFEMLGDTTNGVFPNENFTIHFIPYKVNGLPTNSTTTVDNMPQIDNAQITIEKIKAESLQNVNDRYFKQMKVEVPLPTYTEIGDYWYKVTESVLDENGDTHDVAGVTHDPNTYYLHVQVVKDAGNNDELARLVTLHKPDPNDQTTYINAKTNGVTNIYGNGDIIIKKVVNGNVADADRPFKIYVAMSSTAPVSSDITYKFFDKTDAVVGTPAEIKHNEWTLEGDVYTVRKVVEITANMRVEFFNVPYGVTYTVQEEDYSSNFKLPTYNIDTENMVENGDTIAGTHSTNWSDKYVQGLISDAADTITVINTTDATIDVGVIVDNMPYIVIMLFVIGAVVVFVIARHKRKKVD